MYANRFGNGSSKKTRYLSIDEDDNADDDDHDDNEMTETSLHPNTVNAQPFVQATMQDSVNTQKNNSTNSNPYGSMMFQPPIETMSDEEVKAWIDQYMSKYTVEECKFVPLEEGWYQEFLDWQAAQEKNNLS